MKTKVCNRCNEELSLDKFPKHIANKDNLDNRCKSCKSKMEKHVYQLKRKHPKPEPGPCPICEKHVTNWSLDHNHKTGEFNGYICMQCNLGLGKFRDSIEILSKALAYLKRTTTHEIIN